ncbi:hypothetical protein RHGRI_004381 [Rhododendron griersonianum]|uniref:Uncharacterized protein n=1 Tax=Rhododendron griersonianum TaxID=479676 RepID=A0AAV6L9M9_9ERIC|nr:hypothetical protein RHGRI_004381 [Rhododendron griersonianum]
MTWMHSYGNTGQGDAGPSNYVPHAQPPVEQYTNLAQAHASNELVSDIEEEEMLDDLCTITLLRAIQIKRSRSRRLPFHMSPLLGKAYVDDLMHGREESFEMFMHLLRGNTSSEIQERFQHLEEAMNKHVQKILNCMNRGFTTDKLKPTRRQDDPHEYLDRHEFYKPFKGNCIEALDGTHVMVRCRKKDDRKDLPDLDPELEDKLDERDDEIDGEKDPGMDDIKNDIRNALHRQ